MKTVGKTRKNLAAFYQTYTDSRLAFGQELGRRLAAYRDAQSWQGAAVLDVGCGDGSIAQAFAGCGAQVTAVERSLNRVANMARRLASQSAGPRFRLLAGDGHELPFANEKFDLIILSDVIEHVKNPPRVLQEAARVLRPGGIVYASMPSRYSILNLVSDPHYQVPGVGLMPRWMAAWYVVRLLRLTDGYRTERYFTWGEVVELFRRVGLECQELKGRYERKIETGEMPAARSRRWMAKLLYLPGMRRLALRLARTRLFRYCIQPGWEFLAFKPASAG